MMYKWLSFTLCFFCFSFAQVENKRLEYDILYNDKNIGHIYVTLEKDGENSSIDILSEVDYHSFLFNYQRTTKLITKFNGDDLSYAKSKVTKDGELEALKTTHKKEGYYLCKSLEDEDKKLNVPSIVFTTSKLYYAEPKTVKKVYSATYHEFATVEKVADEHYKLHLPDNKTNEYFYKNDQLMRIVVHRTLFTLTFQKR